MLSWCALPSIPCQKGGMGSIELYITNVHQLMKMLNGQLVWLGDGHQRLHVQVCLYICTNSFDAGMINAHY